MFSSFKSFGIVALSFLVAASSVLAQDNPITSPTGGQVIQAGTVFTITWTPTTTNGTIALALGTGDSADIQVVEPIVSGIPNSGSFAWSVPASIASGDDYTIRISDGNDINFSARFTISSTVTSSSSASSTSTSTSSASSTSTSTVSTTTTSGSSASQSASASGSASGSSTAHASSTSSATSSHAAVTSTSTPPNVPASGAMKIGASLVLVAAAMIAGLFVV